MKFSEFINEALEVAQLPVKLKGLLKNAGWEIQQRPDQWLRSTFTATFSGTPEDALSALTKCIAYLELHDMTFGGRGEGTASWEVRGDGHTFFAEVRFWSVKNKPTAQIDFYPG